MKSFKFRMQTLLEQRERRETVAKQSYAEAQAALGRAEKLLDEMREVRTALLTELSGQTQNVFDPFETRLYQEYMQVIMQSIRDQELDIRDLASTCAVQKLVLVGTSQDRQALVTVRDQHHQAHTQLARHKEQGTMDELATTRFNFQQRAQEAA